MPELIKNFLAEWRQFSAYVSADTPGSVDICIDRNDGRGLQLFTDYPIAEIPNAERALDVCKIMSVAQIITKAEQPATLPAGPVFRGRHCVAVRTDDAVVVTDLAGVEIFRLPREADELEVIREYGIFSKGMVRQWRVGLLEAK